MAHGDMILIAILSLETRFRRHWMLVAFGF
jgi:hypothetical protein